MPSITDIWADVKSKVQGYINPWTDEFEGEIPKAAFSADGKTKDDKKAERLANFVEGLFTDARSYFESEFERTKTLRAGIGRSMTFWDDNLKIEAGRNWEVWGRRKDAGKNKWKEELVDPFTSYNLRARVAYLTGAWHDVQISPNIEDIDPVLDQNRKATDWGGKMTEVVKHMGIFGEAWSISYLDKSYPFGGIANEFICRPGSLLLTPFARGKNKDEGCWYAIHADMVTGQWVAETFPKFNLKKASPSDKNILSYATSENSPRQSTSYTHTKLYDKVEVWMDDPESDPVPFSQEEFDQRFGRLAETLQGVQQEPIPGAEGERVTPLPTDNHPKWIKAYLDVLEERVEFTKKLSDEGRTTEEDEFLVSDLAKLVYEQIAAHEEFAKRMPFGGSKVAKYPYGRHVVKIGGEVAMDQPFEYNADWRKFLHKVYNEKVPLRLDGRSDVEINRSTQFTLDTALSRLADHGLLHGLKKPWFPLSEKATILADGFTHDPTEPGFSTTGEPPRYENTQEPRTYLELITLYQRIAQKNTGISEVSFGSSAPQESGKKVDLLLEQSEMIVTGEANKNLQAYVEEVIEAWLLIMQQFYVEPRPYTIGGKQVLISVAQRLRNIKIETEEGQLVTITYPQFEISVRPDSNAPYKWERELNQLTRILSVLPEEYQPAFIQMIMDLLSQRYPQLGPGGKYNMLNQDAAVGANIREQEEAQLDERRKILEQVAAKRTRKEVEASLERSGGNGRGMGVEV